MTNRASWSFYSDRVETNAPTEPFATPKAAQAAAMTDYLARSPLPECSCPNGCLRWRPSWSGLPRFWLGRHGLFTGHTVFAVEAAAANTSTT